jgi:hypothetical protein
MKQQVKRLTSAWNLKTLYKTWSNADVAAVVRELTQERAAMAPPPAQEYNDLSDHEKFMIRHARKQAEEKATQQAWVEGVGRTAGRNGYHP